MSEAASSTEGKLKRAAPWTVLSRLITLVAMLTVSSLAFRSLPGDAFGLLSVCRTSMLLLVLIASAGLDRTLWRFAPEIREHHGDPGVAALLRRVLRWQALALALVLGLLVWLWRPLLTWLGADEQVVSGAGTEVGAALMALTVGTLAYQTFTQALVSNYRTARVTASTAVRGALWVGAGAALFAASAGTVTRWLLIEAISLGVGSALMVRAAMAGGRPVPRATLDRALPARRQLSLAAVFGISGVVNFVVQRQSEVFFIAKFHGLDLAGQYDLVYAYPQLALEFVPLATSAVVSSALAEVYTRDASQLREATRRYFRLLFTLSIPLAAIGATWADSLLVLLFGDRVAPAAHWAQLFSVLHVVPLVFIPLSAALTTREKAHWVLPLGPAQAALNIGLDLWLIPKYGIAGAAMAVGGTLAFGVPATFWLTHKVMGPSGFPLGHVTRLVALSSVAALAWPLHWVLPPFAAVLLGLPLSVALVAAALWWGKGLGADEKVTLGKLAGRLWRR